MNPATPHPRPAPAHAGAVFVSATGTDAGKTMLSLALTAYGRARGRAMVALKPLETGCNPRPADADSLARAAGDPTLADHPAFYRARPALGPMAIALRGDAAPPDIAGLAAACRERLVPDAPGLVEGAGGLMVPLSPTALLVDLVVALDLPLLLVAPDRLGVQSDVLAAAECAERRGVRLLAVVLNQMTATPDEAAADNAGVLARRLPCPVTTYPFQSDPSPAALVRALPSGLLDTLAW